MEEINNRMFLRNFTFIPPTAFNEDGSINMDAIQKAIAEADQVEIPREKDAPITLRRGSGFHAVTFHIPSPKNNPELKSLLMQMKWD